MSVQSMAEAVSDPARSRTRSTASRRENYVRDLATYIPSEAIALYLFGIGIFAGADPKTLDVQGWSWVAFVVSLALAFFLAWVTFQRGTLTKREARRRQGLISGTAAGAFLAYSAATPGGPFETVFGSGVNLVGAFIAGVLTAVLPYLVGRFIVRNRTPA
jgi:cation transport ATPase